MTLWEDVVLVDHFSLISQRCISNNSFLHERIKEDTAYSPGIRYMLLGKLFSIDL